MANRKHPVLTALRVTSQERALIDAAAEVEGVPVTAFLRKIVLPIVGRRISEHAAALCGDETAPRPAA